MAGTTTTYGFPYPTLPDTPDGPAQIKALADAVDATFTRDASHSQRLTGADVRATQSVTTDILTATLTLAIARVVLISGKARFASDSTGGSDGVVGLAIAVDGTQVDWAGPVTVPAFGSTHGTFTPLSIPVFAASLAAGAHTIKLQADRDGNGVVNTLATSTFGTPAYKPTTLTIII